MNEQWWRQSIESWYGVFHNETDRRVIRDRIEYLRGNRDDSPRLWHYILLQHGARYLKIEHTMDYIDMSVNGEPHYDSHYAAWYAIGKRVWVGIDLSSKVHVPISGWPGISAKVVPLIYFKIKDGVYHRWGGESADELFQVMEACRKPQMWPLCLCMGWARELATRCLEGPLNDR
jgi:hypothetical protein